jgi:hypothetical protein
MSLIVWRSSSVSGPSVVAATRAMARVESEAGLDADRHLVDDIGGVGLDPVLAVVAHAEHPVVGQEEQTRPAAITPSSLAVDEQQKPPSQRA